MVMTDGDYRVIDWRRVTKGWNVERIGLECESGRFVWTQTFNKGENLGWWWTAAYRIDKDRLTLIREYDIPDCEALKDLEEMTRESQATPAEPKAELCSYRVLNKRVRLVGRLENSRRACHPLFKCSFAE